MVNMQSKSLAFAWIAILIAQLGVLLYGLLAVLAPDILIGAFENFTGQSWSALLSTNPETAEYILLVVRLVGAYNIAFGVVAIPIVFFSFRKGEAWSWYALLFGSSAAYLSPMIFDQVVGVIGLFEILEYVFLALVYLALGVSARDVLKGRSGATDTQADRS